MTLSDGLAVAGIAATVVFGVWGLVVVLRRQYPGKLTLVKEPYIALFDSIVKNLPELAVLYNGVPVGQGLVLVKGAFLNTGSKDITDSMTEKRLAVGLPPDFRWLTAKIVDSSGNVNASIAIEDRSVVFTTGLFRCNEFIRFQAIAEVPIHGANGLKTGQSIEERLDNAISITHRIADTQKISSYELPNIVEAKRRLRRHTTMAIAMTVIIAIMFGWTIYTGVPANIHFTVMDRSAKPHLVRVVPQINGNLILKGVDDDYQDELKVNDFFNRAASLNPKIAPSPEAKWMSATLVLYLLLPWGMFAYSYREQRRSRKLRRLLGISESQELPVQKK